MSKINWKDRKADISKWFCVHEAIYLPSWDVYAQPTEEQKVNILELAQVMDKVREIVNAPIIVGCWLRPVEYNKMIGGAKNSAHLSGKGVDFSVAGKSCDEVRALLLPHLEELNVRMEDKLGSNWIHLGNDWSEGKTRFFKP